MSIEPFDDTWRSNISIALSTGRITVVASTGLLLLCLCWSTNAWSKFWPLDFKLRLAKNHRFISIFFSNSSCSVANKQALIQFSIWTSIGSDAYRAFSLFYNSKWLSLLNLQSVFLSFYFLQQWYDYQVTSIIGLSEFSLLLQLLALFLSNINRWIHASPSSSNISYVKALYVFPWNWI